MIPYTWLIAGGAGVLATVGIFLGGAKYGAGSEREARIAGDLARASKVIKVTQIVKEIETQVVTQYRDRIKVIEHRTGEAIEIIRREVPPDCVLPRDFSLQLHRAAGSPDPDRPGAAADAPETYDCRAVLAAIEKDYAASHANAAQLEALQQWAKSLQNIKP